ncbi:MAG: DNA-binding MarR family transcriptional regulator [Paraglaciecola sp.]|jgi:DNA-binding MarR family transcriptional regulator
MSNKVKEPDLRQLICFNFYKGWRVINNFYSHYLPKGVTPQQSYILESCHENHGTTVSEVAQRLENEMSAISSMLKRMESANLIRREVQPDNRRKTSVYLTPQGAQLRDEIRTAMIEADQILTGRLSVDEKAILLNIVDNLRSLEHEDRSQK